MKKRGPHIPEDAKFTMRDRRVEPCPMTGCWLWTGSLSRGGYGECHAEGASCRKAHRMVWQRLVGPIPDGMVLDHICRERSCVNPDHLRVVTRRQNALENSLGLTAINAKRVDCLVCGEPLGYDNRGRRECRPCANKVRRKWWHRIKHTHSPEFRERERARHRAFRAKRKAANNTQENPNATE